MKYAQLVGNIYAVSQQSGQSFARVVWELDPTLEMSNDELACEISTIVDWENSVSKSTNVANTLVDHCDSGQCLTELIRSAAQSSGVEPKRLRNTELKQFIRS